jgi:hypothetical protein
MVNALVYGTGRLQVGVWLMHLFMVQVDAWFIFIGTGLQRYIS